MMFQQYFIATCLLTISFTQYVWPNHQIIYEVDEALYRDQKQLYALLNAKSDLESRTCISFVPRMSGEHNYVLFADLGNHHLCWDLFNKGPGVLPVNVGRSCLSPFGNSKGVSTFSDCDIAYINILYKCPGAEAWLDNERCPRHGFRKFVPTYGTFWGKRPPTTLASINPWPSRRTTNGPGSIKIPSRGSNPYLSTRPTSPSVPPPRSNIKQTKPTTRVPKITTTRELRPKIPIHSITDASEIKSDLICGSMCYYDGILTPLHQSLNEDLGISNHFYTDDRIEQRQMTSNGYGILNDLAYMGQTPSDARCKCLKPLYRLYSELRKDTLLTVEEDERRRATSQLGFKFEKIIGYCTSDPGCGAFMPLYRFFNFFANDHLYTTEQSEAHKYKSNPLLGYGLERIECYLWQYNVSTNACE